MILPVSMAACGGGGGGERDGQEDSVPPQDTDGEESAGDGTEDFSQEGELPDGDGSGDGDGAEDGDPAGPDEAEDLAQDTGDGEDGEADAADAIDAVDAVDTVEVDGDCSLACTTEGERYCTAGGYVECMNLPEGCLAWAEVGCPTGRTCSDFPTPTGCKDVCDDDCSPATGWGRCFGNIYLQCGHYDADPCVDFAVSDICQPGETCFGDGIGCAECLDECPVDGQEVCPSNIDHWVCGNFDADSCLEWDRRTCGDDETCDSATGTCVCLDGCYVPGTRICDGYYGTMLCDDHDGDGCDEWGDRTTCPGTETCSGGTCSTSCSNDCSYEGRHECYTGPRRRICGYYDTDPCLEWTPIEPCPAGLVCWVGAPPGDPCVECIDGEECRPDLQVCRANACVAPPGSCFQTADAFLPGRVGSYLESTATVTAAGTITRFNLFLGMSGLLDMVDADVALYITAPSGTFVIVSCPALIGAGDLFWDVLSSDTRSELAAFVGQEASGAWRLGVLACGGDSDAMLETWAVCPEF